MSGRAAGVPSVTPAELRDFAGRFTTGVTVVTTCDAAGNPYGLTMNAVTSLSLDPPLLLICVDRTSSTHALLCASGVFGVNVLRSGQTAVSNWFASKRPDKFAASGYGFGRLGVPLLHDALAVAECRITQVSAGGDHDIIVGAVAHTDVRSGDPLVFYRGAYARLES